jgi:hypothetical protein
LPDDEWLKNLKANPAFAKTNVDLEVSRCRVWCETNGKGFTRRRIVNWLNRDRPVTVNGAHRRSEDKQIQEHIELPIITIT